MLKQQVFRLMIGLAVALAMFGGIIAAKASALTGTHAAGHHPSAEVEPYPPSH